MSQETNSVLLIRLEAFQRIFVFCPKIDVFPRGNKPMVMGQKRPNFKVGILDSFMSLGIPACCKTFLGMILECI